MLCAGLLRISSEQMPDNHQRLKGVTGHGEETVQHITPRKMANRDFYTLVLVWI